MNRIRDTQVRLMKVFQEIREGTIVGYLRQRRLYRAKINMGKRTAWWEAQKISKKSFDTSVYPSIKIRLYFDSLLCREIFVTSFEDAERTFVRRFLRPGDIFIDVGANIGLFTLNAAKAVGRKGRVYAFEPTAETYVRLIENVTLNQFKNVVCNQLALSDENAIKTLKVSRIGYDAWNSFGVPIAGEQFTSQDVMATTWDSFVQENDLMGKVTLMKIDVEGWESRVLKGGATSLSKEDAPVLIVEFTDKCAQAAGTSCRALYMQLCDLGYRVFRYDARTNTLLPEALREAYPYDNLIAVKRQRAVELRLASSWSLT